MKYTKKRCENTGKYSENHLILFYCNKIIWKVFPKFMCVKQFLRTWKEPKERQEKEKQWNENENEEKIEQQFV